ncbi:Mth938-like domain-containing protein [Candidatus Woesearchaeota archaeon]|nr:Mth938-like domain-containing protein [Candidatus Woesearchaeota archaeon]
MLRHFDNHIITKDDFVPLVEAKPEVIIIGTGASGVVQVSNEIIEFIESFKIKLIIKKTTDACDEYNRLIKRGVKVCALLHNTC